MPKGIIDIALLYSFLKRLVTPFSEWEAFKQGVIDDEGSILIPIDKRSPAQRDSYGYYDRVVANLKKLIGKVPGGKTRLASFASALLLMREENVTSDPEELRVLLVYYMDQVHNFIPEEVINTVGSNIGADTVDNPTPKRLKPKKIMRRKRSDSDFL